MSVVTSIAVVRGFAHAARSSHSVPTATGSPVNSVYVWLIRLRRPLRQVTRPSY
jgi:hypothetical protein